MFYKVHSRRTRNEIISIMINKRSIAYILNSVYVSIHE